jgi:hypothetical protein
MRLVDSTMRLAIPTLGVGVRWLKEELRARSVSVRLTDACLRELVMDAEAAVRVESSATSTAGPYVERLRRQIASRAEFLRTWTLSDERIDLDDPLCERLVGIARRYALPRPWKLSEPVVSECPRRTPSYLYWARSN